MLWINATLLEANNPPSAIWVNLSKVQWMRRDTKHPEAYTLLYFGGGPGINVSETPEELLRRAQVSPPDTFSGQ
jgi:hypothetical protein